MKKASLAILVSLSALTSVAYAQQVDSNGVAWSTDPQRAAAVEQHAQQVVQTRQEVVRTGRHVRKHHGVVKHHRKAVKKAAKAAAAAQ